MHRRPRVHGDSDRCERFSKFLKPGALAKLRDSKICARSHRLTRRVNPLPALSSSVPSTSVPSIHVGSAESFERLVKFSSQICGTQRFGRKKVSAGRSSAFLLDFSAASPVRDAGDSIVISILERMSEGSTALLW